MNSGCNYDIVLTTEEAIIIRDMCNERGGRSVTNGAEDVIKELSESLRDRHLYYIDTMGLTDEIVYRRHPGGPYEFVGFKPARRLDI